MPFLYVAIVTPISYKIWNYLSHPNSKVWNNLPQIKLRWFQLFPSVRIFIKGRVIHFHHWFSLSILLCISIFVTGGILDSWITRGALMGGIIQGLTTKSPTARKIIYRKIVDVQL